MGRFHGRRTFASVIAAGLACATACGRDAEVRPNLLLVTLDSTRADVLGCYGGDPTVGVAACSLADAGVRYAWAFSAAPSSAPAIASLLTSTHPGTHGVRASPATFLRAESETLPDVLRRHGYATAAFVGSPELNRSRNLQQGFDLYDDRSDDTVAGDAPERRAEELTDAVIRWVRDAESPWFVWVHYRDPHGPYDPPVDTASAVVGPAGPAAGAAPGPGERLPVLATATGRGGIPAYQALPGLFTREAYELRYRAEVRYVDGQLARLFEALASLREPVGIALTADHGEALGEDRYFFTHGHSVGLDQIRVPLFWRPPRSDAPGAPASPGRIDVPVSTLDVAPTLVRAAGIERPAAFDGRALPTGPDPAGAPQTRAIFAESETQAAVIVGSTYYARARRLDEPISLELPSAQALASAGARTARIDVAPDAGDGPLPVYQEARPAGAAAVLEPSLAAFLAGEPDAGAE